MSRYDALPDGLPPHTPRWSSEGFRQELKTWVASELGPVTAMEQVELRPWATVWRATTSAGDHFAKQNCALQSPIWGRC